MKPELQKLVDAVIRNTPRKSSMTLATQPKPSRAEAPKAKPKGFLESLVDF